MAEVLEYLNTASACPESFKNAIKTTLNDLKDEKVRQEYVECGVIEVLRDISISDDYSVCTNALEALNHLVCGNLPAKLKLLRPPGFLMKLINFCSPKNHCVTDCQKATLYLHEQAVDLIRKLVLCPECVTEVASLDVIAHMIEISGIFFHYSKHVNCCLDISQFSPRATSYLHELSHGKRLVGKVSQFTPDISKNIVKQCKSQVEGILSTTGPNLSVLSVDLYDTTTDQDIKISEEIIKEGLAWPQFLSLDEQSKMFAQPKGKEEHVWADIMVTSVVDGGHFWAQVGGDVVHNKLREIKNTLQCEDLVKLTVAPKVGDLVCIKTIVGGHQDLYRGKVLQVLATDQETLVEVFALDYGYENVVSAHCLRVLTAAGREEHFQARFCCLTGVQAPPINSSVVENAAGSLRNLAYSSNACRLRILEKDGVDALLKLCVVPEKGVCHQALGAILNLSMSIKTRARIGYLGAVKILIDIIQKYLRQDVQLICLAIGALRNLMLDMPVNRGRVAELDGILVLTHVYFTCTDNYVKQECLGALKNLVGNAWYLLTGTGGVDLRSVVNNNHSRPLTLAVATEKPYKHPTVVHRSRDKLRPGEVQAKPVEKALAAHVIKSSNSSCDESDKEGLSGLSNSEYTDGDTDGGEEGLLVPSPVSVREECGSRNEKINENSQNYYVQGQIVPFCDDELHELRETKSTKGLSSAVVSRPACAFLNAGKGGTVYMGVKKSRVVCGVEIGRKDRDRLRVGVDELLNDFKPPVRYDKYQVNFVPVAKENSSNRKSIEFIPDVFVIEVVFQKSSETIYSTNKRRCYFRCGTSNNEFSTQEIRKWVIRNQEALYNTQIKSLKKELADSKQELATDGV